MKRLALLLPLLALAAGCANVSFSQPGGETPTVFSATVSDWTLSVLNGNTGEPPSLRLVRGGEPVDWRPPERLAAWVAGTDGKFVVSPFRGILGFDGFRVDALSGTTGSRLTCYLAVIGDDLVPVADSFGDPGDEDHAVDLDGDGLDELVCDVTWEMGGHPRVHLFRRMDDVSMLCDDPTPLLPEPASSLAWAGHLRERYDPKTKTIRIRYLPERRVQESHGSIGEEMYDEVACPILLERLSWHPATNAPAPHEPAADGAKEPATNENAAFMGDVVLFPNEDSPIWKFQSFHHDAENNVSTDVFPVEPASPPFDLIGTWCRTTADFLLRIRMAGEGIQPIAELWQSANEHNPNQGQLFIDWSPGTTEIAAGIELHPDSASGLVLDFWSWETKVGKERALGPGMHNADFGESPVFASVRGKSVHPFALSHSSSNGVLQAYTWSDPVRVATHPVFRADGSIRPEEGNAVSGSALEKELRSFPTPSACLRNVPLGEIVDLLGHVFRSERVCAGEPSRSAVEGGTEWFLPFFEGSSDGPDPERLVKCSGFGNLPERFVSDPRISAYVRDADALTFLKQIAAAANGGVSVIDGGVRIFVPAPPATNAPATHAESGDGAKEPAP